MCESHENCGKVFLCSRYKNLSLQWNLSRDRETCLIFNCVSEAWLRRFNAIVTVVSSYFSRVSWMKLVKKFHDSRKLSLTQQTLVGEMRTRETFIPSNLPLIVFPSSILFDFLLKFLRIDKLGDLLYWSAGHCKQNTSALHWKLILRAKTSPKRGKFEVWWERLNENPWFDESLNFWTCFGSKIIFFLEISRLECAQWVSFLNNKFKIQIHIYFKLTNHQPWIKKAWEHLPPSFLNQSSSILSSLQSKLHNKNIQLEIISAPRYSLLGK